MILSQNIGFSDAGNLDRCSEVTKLPLIIIVSVAQAVVTGSLRGIPRPIHPSICQSTRASGRAPEYSLAMPAFRDSMPAVHNHSQRLPCQI